MTQITHSPQWNATTKLVITLTLIAIIAALLVKFQNVVPPLIISFTLVYLLYPVASFLTHRLKINWAISVTLLYLLLLVVLVGLLTVVGLELVVQIQSLINLVGSSLNQLPGLTQEISSQIPTSIGPFSIDLASLDLNSLSGQIISSTQALLGRTGELLGTLAGGAVNTAGWGMFVLLTSFFMLLESGGLREEILPLSVPGYAEDFQRMSKELGRIWNAFFRGQLIIISIAILVYSVVLSLLGVNYALGLAVLAGSARFLPYIGAFISWTVLALVTFFQPYKPFDLSAFSYMLIVLVIAWVIDGTLDNIVSPRIMAESLKVHPAAVLVAAIISLDLLGILGVMIAAPILATLQLGMGYVIRKLFDLDPWAGMTENPTPPLLREQIAQWLEKMRKRIKFWTTLRKI